jgi:hypothetical protein
MERQVSEQLSMFPPDALKELLERGLDNYKASIGSTDMLYWSGWVEALKQLDQARKAQHRAAMMEVGRRP